jgi:L-lactate utilization protein LutB
MDEKQRHLVADNFADARRTFLIYQRPKEYARMDKAGELRGHLELIGRQAADLYETLITQLKAQDQENGVQTNYAQMSNTAWELALADIVHV